MIIPSLIYLAITVLLAGVDALRIKAVQGKQENIEHGWSVLFAAFAGMAVLGFSRLDLVGKGWYGFSRAIPISLGFIAIRLLIYDMALNAFRFLPIDYQSPTTTAKTDQLTFGILFWEKRLFAAVGWGMVFIVYHAIFKTW